MTGYSTAPHHCPHKVFNKSCCPVRVTCNYPEDHTLKHFWDSQMFSSFTHYRHCCLLSHSSRLVSLNVMWSLKKKI